jgi:type IV pilus assembly protein PilE
MRASGQRGVSLIELMVVIVILAVLVSFAASAFIDYRRRAHRTLATSALAEIAMNQSNFFLTNNTFAADFDVLGYPGGVTHDGVYLLEFVGTPDVNGFTVRARPAPGGGSNGIDQSRDDDCQWFTLNARNVRDSGPEPDCWGS